MWELILSDILYFLCHFLEENDNENKFENQLPKK